MTKIKKKRLNLEQELLLTEAYFFAKERGFTKEDEATINAYKKMLDTFRLRPDESGMKQAAIAKELGISFITLWRRFIKKNWKQKEINLFLRLTHKA